MIVVGLCFVSAFSFAGSTPTENAKVWASNMGIEFKGINCADFDSNCDGYVTCDLNLGDGKFERLQCASDAVRCKDADGCETRIPPKTGGCKRDIPVLR